MSSEESDSRSTLDGKVDIKTAFMGACSLIVFLTGAVFHLWDRADQREREQTDKLIQQLQTRVAELEASSTGYRFELTHLQQGHEAQNRAIYNLERDHLQLTNRGTP